MNQILLHALLFRCFEWVSFVALRALGLPEAVSAGAADRLTGSLHNAIQVPRALLVVSRYWVAWQGRRASASSELTRAAVALSAGFFLYDIDQCRRRLREQGALFLVHGVVAFAICLYTSASGVFQFYNCAFLLWEASTPFVHLRWFLRQAGAGRRLQDLNGACLVATFFAFRIVFGVLLSSMFWADCLGSLGAGAGARARDVALVGAFLGANVVSNALNVYWFSLMARKTLARLGLLGAPRK